MLKFSGCYQSVKAAITCTFNINTVNSPLTDILVSGQLYLWTLFSIPLFTIFPLCMVGIILVSGQPY